MISQKFKDLTIGDVIVKQTSNGLVLKPKKKVITKHAKKPDYLDLIKDGWSIDSFDSRGKIYFTKRSKKI